MTESTTSTGNMLCGKCRAFQPVAEICRECGVVVAKVAPRSGVGAAAPVTAGASRRPRETAAPRVLPGARTLLALVVIAVIGFGMAFRFMGRGTATVERLRDRLEQEQTLGDLAQSGATAQRQALQAQQVAVNCARLESMCSNPLTDNDKRKCENGRQRFSCPR